MPLPLMVVNKNTVKVEDQSELLACRICLVWDMRLHHIHEAGLDQTLSELMGISVTASDGLPQHLCSWCRTVLLKAARLRACSRNSDSLLRQVLTHQQTITNEYIRTIDRSTNKLTHTLSRNLKTNVQYYFEQDKTLENVNVHTDIDIIKDEIESNENGLNDKVEVETDVLQINIIEGDIKAFDINCDRIADHSEDSDEDCKLNLREYKYKMENINPELKPELVEVKISSGIDKQIKKVSKKHRLKEINVETYQNNKRHPKANKVRNKNNHTNAVQTKTVKERDPEPGRFFTIEEIEEFVKKHNFEIQYLTEEEMTEEMARRKLSERYKHCKFKCNLCYKGFLTSTTFDNHMKKDHDPRNAKNECRLCRVSYRYGFYLKQHVQNAHRLRLRCAECGEGVWGRKECVAHAARHAGTTRQCKYCGKHFLKKSSYTWHMRAAHPVENSARGSCELCGEIYTSAKGLKAHKLLAHNKRSAPELQCRHCRAQFDNKEALTRHQQQRADDKCDPDLSPCAACGAGCAGAEALLRHMRASHNVDIFTCDLCNKSFLSKPSLSTHIDRVHLGIRPLQHHQLTQYKKHSKRPVQHKRRGHDHMCEHCGKAYTVNNTCTCDICKHIHLRNMQTYTCYIYLDRVHLGIRPLQHHQLTQYKKHSKRPVQHKRRGHDHMCEHCGKAYTVNNTCTCDICKHIHLRNMQTYTCYIYLDRVHLGIRPLQHHQLTQYKKHSKRPVQHKRRGHDHMCEHCGKAYTTHQFLKNHQMTHTGERPFKCDRCPKGFTTAVQLTWHTRTHTGERPFQCDQCHQAFSLEGNLRRHRKAVHLGLRKNVPCPRCDKTFSTNSTMKLHVRTVHDGAPWPRRDRRPRKQQQITE